jgi:FKBP-type peptidyl-prolyl cis-trans isomerase (trigger factor)
MSRIRTTTELLEAAAEALSNGDELTLDELKSTVHDWLQPEAERNAQLAMLEAMLDALGRME